MRRLTPRSNHGVTAVVFAIVAPVLIAAVGLSVDSGNLVLQRANAQKAADSAALAIGQDCARATRPTATATQKQRCTPAGAQSTAQLMVNGNAPGAAASTPTSLTASQGKLTLSVSKTVPMNFAGAVGVGPKTVSASSTVTWGQVPTAGTTFPLGMNVCDYNEWKLNPSSSHELYRYDTNQSGRGLFTNARTCAKPGGGTDRSIYGALWLVDAGAWFSEAGCTVSTGIGFTGAISATNLLFPSGCVAKAQNLVSGKTYLLPIFDSPTWYGSGSTLFPKIRGYAPFVITGWTIGGSLNVGLVETRDYSAPRCYDRVFFFWNGCRGLQGYFTGSIVQLGEVDSYGVDPDADFGAIRVKITG
jgi:Flp pilus assembly protein TadG